MEEKVEEEQVQSEAGEGEEIEEIKVRNLGDDKLGNGEKPDLDGEEVGIADLALIPKSEEQKSKDGAFTYRAVLLKLTYSNDAFEHYGGMRQFKHDGEWAEPTFWTSGKSALAHLFRAWLVKTDKVAHDVSLKDFLTSLVGMKAVLRGETVEFAGKEYHKNVVDHFV